MIEKKIITKLYEVEEISKFILNKMYGEIITFEDLQDYTHYDLKNEVESYKFKSNIMNKVKNKLINYGYVIKNIRNKGYYILKPNQIQSYTYRTYIKKPIKSYLKAETILKNSNIQNLNKEELIKHQLTLELSEKIISENNRLINSDQYSKLDILDEK